MTLSPFSQIFIQTSPVSVLGEEGRLRNLMSCRSEAHKLLEPHRSYFREYKAQWFDNHSLMCGWGCSHRRVSYSVPRLNCLFITSITRQRKTDSSGVTKIYKDAHPLTWRMTYAQIGDLAFPILQPCADKKLSAIRKYTVINIFSVKLNLSLLSSTSLVIFRIALH